MPKAAENQQGVALLTVLLVVAMASMLAVSMIKAQQSLLQRSSSVFTQDQAYLYTLGAETLARTVLQDDTDRDKQKNPSQDALGEDWARRVPPFPVEGGAVQAKLDDLQGRFNVNSLWQDNQVNPTALKVYQRLLAQVGVSPGLASPLIDWLDPDSLPYDSEGAEEDWYLRLKPAYRTANRAMVSTSELALLRGYTPEVIRKIAPYVCALPANTAININTADPMLIASLSDSISFNMAKEMVKERPSDGYGSVERFLQLPGFSALSSDDRQALTKLLDVRSRFFEVRAEAEIDGKRRVLSARLMRTESGIRTLDRDWSRQWTVATTTETANKKDNP
ncbi:type II secretion system protein K (GspK) [Fluviicoccus keumensis]|uniref:Type II secretion system protein K n=1 Tax=Fluviicoccus keumensis TaxID=1435465 RepID=A0A4Q7Z694_9GAMM|nr:type II secretion system minor pseudopilin GspK [Fluviicoccus keumensis]RZU45169.1 type II secretion system protein K (GspK) [Fluviicoccus keumensis]